MTWLAFGEDILLMVCHWKHFAVAFALFRVWHRGCSRFSLVVLLPNISSLVCRPLESSVRSMWFLEEGRGHWQVKHDLNLDLNRPIRGRTKRGERAVYG